MQINIDKKTGSLLGIIVILIAVIVGISYNNNHMSGMHGDEEMGMQSNSSSSDFTGADVMFLQMMIPHHQQAIDISNLALKTSQDAELIELAKTIIAAQSSEITKMKAWLKEAGASGDAGHHMSGMGGMLDEEELSSLTAASGTEFDILWLKGMINHHDGAIHMTEMIEDAENADIKAFGTAIVKDQSAQITQMNAMLARIGK